MFNKQKMLPWRQAQHNGALSSDTKRLPHCVCCLINSNVATSTIKSLSLLLNLKDGGSSICSIEDKWIHVTGSSSPRMPSDHMKLHLLSKMIFLQCQLGSLYANWKCAFSGLFAQLGTWDHSEYLSSYLMACDSSSRGKQQLCWGETTLYYNANMSE